MNYKKLSNIELYYSPSSLKEKNLIKIVGEELNHIGKVMRHKTGDVLFITDGVGRIYDTTITRITPEFIETSIKQEHKFENPRGNIFFCVPKLKNVDRFETALEKCTELGVTNFIVFESERTISKTDKPERWRKIITAAMKQSLRSFLPTIKMVNSLSEIAAMDGEIILFVQDAEQTFNRDTITKLSNYYFIFGPEGDFSDTEKNIFNRKSLYNLGNHRLRSETAIIKCASIIS